MSEKTNEQRLNEIGKNTFYGIREMVAALQCDYLRLEELRDERDGWDAEEELNWVLSNPEDAEELQQLELDAGECEDEDQARERVQEHPLSVQIRSGWYYPGSDPEPVEFEILLGTGGPATRIIGDLGEHGEPTSARLEVQDWGTPWTEYRDADEDILLEYCQCFYFGE